MLVRVFEPVPRLGSRAGWTQWYGEGEHGRQERDQAHCECGAQRDEKVARRQQASLRTSLIGARLTERGDGGILSRECAGEDWGYCGAQQFGERFGLYGMACSARLDGLSMLLSSGSLVIAMAFRARRCGR